MSKRHSRSHALVGFTAAFWIPLALVAAGSAPPKTLNVTVLPDRYLVAGKPIGLDALESTVQKSRAEAVRLDGCGSAAYQRLLVAAARLNALYLDIRTAAPGPRGCPPSTEDTAERARRSSGVVLVSSGDPSAEYWRSVMP